MNGADLRGSLIATLRYLLNSNDTIEQQLAEARKVITLSFEQSEAEGVQPISIEQDAVWYNYLLESQNQIKKDIALTARALSQIGVSVSPILADINAQNNILNENQGTSALDFSIEREL